MRTFSQAELAVAIALATFAVTPSLAMTYPYHLHQEQNIDDHQVGWIDLDINSNGTGLLTASFSNGKQIAGNNFYSIAVLRRKDGTIIDHPILQEKGLDGSWGGHAREGHVTNTLTLNAEQLASFDHVELKMGVRNCGMTVVEMHNLNDWTFSTQKCDPPAAPTHLDHTVR
jgi:hypothetical protein